MVWQACWVGSAICAALLRPTTATNIIALRQREPSNPALTAYADAADAVTGERDIDGLLDWMAVLEDRFRLPALSISTVDRDAVVDGALRASSMRGNPVELTRDELQGILSQATGPHSG